jgi:hypothetical protein
MGRKYTEEHIQFIADNIAGRSHREMADMFNKHFGTDIPQKKIMSLSFTHGLKNGRDCRLHKGHEPTQFQKGSVPWNKGMKGLAIGGEATRFKKGQRGRNWLPIGTERVNTDGYVDVKIAERKWRQKNILIWEAANGPIPKGHCLIFADSNPLNVTLDNLILITRAELAVMNRRGLIAQSAELTKVGVTVAKVMRKVAERKRNGKVAEG